LNVNAVTNGTAHHQNILVAAAAPPLNLLKSPSEAGGAGVAQVDAARLYNSYSRHLRWQ
jgi:hypothetical protein